MAIETRLARNEGELEAIYHLRFKVYYEELCSLLPEDTIRNKRLCDELDGVALNYASFTDEGIAGCVRVFDLKDVANPAHLVQRYRLGPLLDSLDKKTVTFTGRLALLPRFRRSSLVQRLMLLATEEARQRGQRIAFLDCSPHLLPFYEAYGFRRYAPAFTDPVFGFKQPLLFLLRDKETLTALKSPLARSASSFDDDPEMRAWYGKHCAAHSTPLSALLGPIDQFIEAVSNRFGDVLGCIPFFHQLCYQDIESILKKATIVHAEPSDNIMRPGLREGFLVIVLSGRMDYHSPLGATISTIGKGGVCGDVEFLTDMPRIGEVSCVEPSELLILPSDHLGHLIDKDPVLGRTILRNIGKSVAHKTISFIESSGACRDVTVRPSLLSRGTASVRVTAITS